MGISNSSNGERKLKKDMSLDFNHKVAENLEEIDNYKQLLLQDKRYIVNLNERIHNLFIKLSAKMNTTEKRMQFLYKKKLARIKIFDRKKTLNSDRQVIYQRIIIKKNYLLFKDLLERREMHLNEVMERIGLTAVERKERRLIY